MRANFANKSGFACDFALSSAQRVGASATYTYFSTTSNTATFDHTRLVQAATEPTRYFAEAGILKIMNPTTLALTQGWNEFLVSCATENTLMDFEILMN